MKVYQLAEKRWKQRLENKDYRVPLLSRALCFQRSLHELHEESYKCWVAEATALCRRPYISIK